MSVYRLHTNGISVRLGKDPIGSYKKLELLYDAFDTHTNQEYSSLIENEKKRLLRFYKKQNSSLKKRVIKEKYPLIFRLLSRVKKILLNPVWRINA